MKRWNWAILPVFILVSGFAFLGCGTKNPWNGHPGRPRVDASFPPLTSGFKKLINDRAAVITRCTTTGPHDFNVDIRQAVLLREADLLLANGLGLDDAITDRLNSNSGNRGLRYRKLAAWSLSKSER